ncbi:hypothetical protein CAEBREN_29217 [Caenorhabditis brenneri]|uniref:Uncharacterized protein n=1 Tax=Caenorhabditis brenneri TaxID=135651 RepID=G0NBJ5_CAEBE|nr:hypothetical protein CAEBREN_29217 [Caenorhabditis brenneri]
MRTVWNLDREFIKLNQDMVMTQMAIHDAHNMIPYLEMRRNELLAGITEGFDQYFLKNKSPDDIHISVLTNTMANLKS